MKASNLTPDPDAVRRLVTAIPCHQGSLAALAAHERGRALLAQCPALAVMVVRSGEGLSGDARRLHWHKLAALPWRETLAHLGFPARQRTLRLLGKLPAAHCYVPTVQRLRRVLTASRHPWRHVLSHLSRFTRDTVSLLQLDAELVSPELLRASTESDCDVETISWLVVGVRSLLLQSGHRGPWPFAGVGDVVARLKLAEGELLAQLHPDPTAFPTPPFAGRHGAIEPIRDLFALAKEGEDNDAFVALLPEILLGEVFVYAVRRPARATLALRRRNAFDEWRLSELRGPHHAAPAPATVSIVQAWLQAEQKAVPQN